MIEQKLNDRAWRRKNWLLVFTAAVPIFGWLALLAMGDRSGRKQFRRTGKIYGWVTICFTLLYLNQNPLLQILYDLFRNNETLTAVYWGLYRMSSNLWMFPLGLWLACLIHTLFLGKTYLDYLALRETNMPPRNALVYDKAWRRKNLGWLLWSLLPYLGPLSLIHAGSRLNNKKLYRGAVVAAIMTVLVLALPNSSHYYFDLPRGWASILADLRYDYLPVQWIVCLLLSFQIREKYLDARASEWEEQTKRYPMLQEAKWCSVNSLWQIWTLLPLVGGIGITLAGLRMKTKKISILGVLFCICNAALFGLSACLREITTAVIRALSLPTYGDFYGFMTYSVSDSLEMLIVALAIAIFAYGTRIRWDILKARAKALQGYRSEFDRDLDMQTRIQARKLELPTEPAAVVPQLEPAKPEPVKPEPVIPQTVAPKTTVSTRVEIPSDIPVDINHCTQAELMQLPGISVVLAKQAMEYRTANGGFQSVEEFVEKLHIKPHFAVQIFNMATVSPNTPATPKTETGTVRRMIDF